MITDEQLKELIYDLMVDDYPGYMAYSEVVWAQYPDEIEALTDGEQDQVYDRIAELVRTARITITWPDEV